MPRLLLDFISFGSSCRAAGPTSSGQSPLKSALPFRSTRAFLLRASLGDQVTWGNVSVLEAALSCFHKLESLPNWRYLLNIAGSDFPLRSNLAIVRHLKTLQGYSLDALTNTVPKLWPGDGQTN